VRLTCFHKAELRTHGHEFPLIQLNLYETFVGVFSRTLGHTRTKLVSNDIFSTFQRSWVIIRYEYSHDNSPYTSQLQAASLRPPWQNSLLDLRGTDRLAMILLV